MPNKIIKLTISAVIGIITLLHIFFPALGIDAVTLGLLVLLFTPWIIHLIKSIKLPDGTEITLADLKKADQKIEQSGLLDKAETTEKIVIAQAKPPLLQATAFDSGEENKIYTGDDVNLTLASMRIEIERSLRKLALQRHLSVEAATPINVMLAILAEGHIISDEQRTALMDLTKLLNRAVHGAEIDKEAAEWAVTNGNRLLITLNNKVLPRALQNNDPDAL